MTASAFDLAALQKEEHIYLTTQEICMVTRKVISYSTNKVIDALDIGKQKGTPQQCLDFWIISYSKIKQL